MEHLPNLADLVNSNDGILVDIRCVLVFADPESRLEPSRLGPCSWTCHVSDVDVTVLSTRFYFSIARLEVIPSYPRVAPEKVFLTIPKRLLERCFMIFATSWSRSVTKDGKGIAPRSGDQSWRLHPDRELSMHERLALSNLLN
jgi:hypothetical protein